MSAALAAVSMCSEADLQVSAGEVLQDAPRDAEQHGAQQDVAGAVGEVVVASGLVGAQGADLVA